MELDPIVLLAYVSVSLNLITIVAAVVTYVVFWLRRRAKKRAPQRENTSPLVDAPRIFLELYVPRARQDTHLQSTSDGARLLA